MQDYRVEYLNKDGIIVLVLYQRYDPPEVWIRRIKDKQSIRIGSLVEQYFGAEETIFERYAGQNRLYFNYSSFDYYQDFLITYLEQLTDIGDFVQKINDWIQKKYS